MADFMSVLTSVVGTTGLAAAMSAGSFWLFKTAMEKRLDATLEDRKAELAQATERLRAELNGAAALARLAGERRFALLEDIWEASSKLWRDVTNAPRGTAVRAIIEHLEKVRAAAAFFPEDLVEFFNNYRSTMIHIQDRLGRNELEGIDGIIDRACRDLTNRVRQEFVADARPRRDVARLP